ncbi:hypothetical protein Bbelb_260520 [Branchiostoma belcheri]|nr:hypothetical protein Bbelb_260520 [Branchiostoma belcheri]
MAMCSCAWEEWRGSETTSLVLTETCDKSCSKPVDLKMLSEEFVQVCSCPDWEKPVMMRNSCPDKMRQTSRLEDTCEMKSSYRCGPRDWTEREEELDVYQPSCVKEDGEV